MKIKRGIISTQSSFGLFIRLGVIHLTEVVELVVTAGAGSYNIF